MKLIMTIFLTLISTFSFAQENTSPEALFAMANKSYDRGNLFLGEAKKIELEKAVKLYRAILSNANGNANVLYNLGNTFARLNLPVQALVSYRRALKYNPANNDIKQNILIVREQLQGEKRSYEKSSLFRTVFFWHYNLHLAQTTNLFFDVYFAAVFVGLLWLFKPNKLILRTALCISTLSVLLFISMSLKIHSERTEQDIIVISDSSSARTGPVAGAPIREVLLLGAELRVLDYKEKWFKVDLGEGESAWVSQDEVVLI